MSEFASSFEGVQWRIIKTFPFRLGWNHYEMPGNNPYDFFICDVFANRGLCPNTCVRSASRTVWSRGDSPSQRCSLTMRTKRIPFDMDSLLREGFLSPNDKYLSLLLIRQRRLKGGWWWSQRVCSMLLIVYESIILTSSMWLEQVDSNR